jgi:hypothetical protein
MVTISLVAVTAIFAATIAIGTFSDSAFAAAGQLAVGAPQSNAQSARANNNGLAGIAADVGENAEVGNICVNALSSSSGC